MTGSHFMAATAQHLRDTCFLLLDSSGALAVCLPEIFGSCLVTSLQSILEAQDPSNKPFLLGRFSYFFFLLKLCMYITLYSTLLCVIFFMVLRANSLRGRIWLSGPATTLGSSKEDSGEQIRHNTPEFKLIASIDILFYSQGPNLVQPISLESLTPSNVITYKNFYEKVAHE